MYLSFLHRNVDLVLESVYLIDSADLTTILIDLLKCLSVLGGLDAENEHLWNTCRSPENYL